MGLVGSLEDLSLLDILQIVNVSRRTGVLRLHRGEFGSAFIFFHEGAVREILGDFNEGAFLDYFLEQGLVDQSEADEAIEQAGSDRGRAVFHLLENGALNERLVEQARRQELARRLKSLVGQKQGEFAFYLADAPAEQEGEFPKPHMPLSLPVSPQVLLTEEPMTAEVKPTAPPPPLEEEAPAPPSQEPRPQSPDIEEPAPATAESERPPVEEKAIPEALIVEEIPVEEEEVEAKPVTPSRASEPLRPSMSTPKNQITIVLAADDSIFKNMLWQRLLTHFSQVERVANQGEYLDLCRSLIDKRRPFVALVDLLMPTQDGKGYLGGLEILETSQVRFPEIKVLLMSDLNDPTLRDMAQTKGAEVILQKPELGRLQIGQLEEAIQEFAQKICADVDDLIPPVEEEVASFFRELGAEQVSDGYRVRDQLTLLKGLMGELANPHESSEISLLVLRLASEYFERAILFLVKKDEISGLGGFGETGDTEMMMQKVRNMKVPTEMDSVLNAAVQKKASIQRREKNFTEIDYDFSQALGIYAPQEMVAIPMLSRGRVIAILYADNAVSGDETPDISGIEIFMAQAGLAMEKTLLERQLLTLRKGISTKPSLDG